MPINREIARLTDLIEKDQSVANLYAERALCYRMQERYVLSERDLNLAIERDPQNPVYYMDRGFSRHMHGDHDGAIADLTCAMALAGGRNDLVTRALRLRINAKEGNGQPEEAMEDINLLVEWVPDDLQVRLMRGSRLINRHMLDDAWCDIRYALKIDAHDLSARVLHARYLLKQQHYAQAEEILCGVLREHHDNEDFVDLNRPYWAEARRRQGKDLIPDW
ncbi:MAG: hypothetical protein CL607_01535 [Anaerolineaceae bacterium]|nr:hypothetical protein [Anaerolineaceae bacterium]